MDQDDYASYELVDVEEERAVSDAFMFLNEGVVYHYVGWLRFVGRKCRFLKYRHGTETILAAEQATVCEECKRRMHDMAQALGMELAELRGRWSVRTPESCRADAFCGHC